ncbi:MAG: ribonuclease Y [Thermodesulfobacteriota bacterium]|nr:ribonuclease Y [Thermodesulfobacteriota bacterium]
MLIIYIGIALIAGIVAGYGVSVYLSHKARTDAESAASRIMDNAKKEMSNIVGDARREAKEIIFLARADADQEAKERVKEVSATEKRLVQREEMLDKKMFSFDAREKEIKGNEQSLADRKKNMETREAESFEMHEKAIKRLEEVGGISADEAKKALMEGMESEARHDAAKKIHQIAEDALAEADHKSRRILSTAIQRYAADVVSERTVSVVNLPGEEMKGRIIGREGRNIRSIESVTGVDLIIDDTPDAVIISSFDPVKREVARQSLERLVVDGRIHPSRVEEVVKKVRDELDETMWEAGQEATFDVGLHGINPELIKMIGRLKYRTSFSQNVYQHSMEVAHLCGVLAAEIGADQKTAKRVGLLHDIGKAVDHEVEGSHAIIGAEMAKRHGESAMVVEAIASHHNDTPVNSVYGFLVQAADSLSAARPGARREMLENYVKRLSDLEGIAKGFNGVSSAFAVQAGREIRVMVDVKRVKDDSITSLAGDISKAIEKELSYPGQIRVVVIRESRAIDYAK